MTKHVNMRPPELVNRPAKNRGGQLAGVAVIAICVALGWSMAALTGFEPPPRVKTAVSDLRQNIAYNISQARNTLYDTLFR